ncbi:5-(carboxyamino)imidazole ribonucleotide synthase [Altericroceibacterium spongiae]|uniref:N5-carboxyaminoimidazole ribonucleotide synthase n=1 Tax=Altericroceibacterium spongiae TaxID=2320269 RepID=A0A420EIH3_9SPHN|nr:5-(carboxyamino)imidazole ribonucleotide synthase [Altericroceibacterium spongiae]RKF20521.1 5-(carboxyamino)imidazole ribonucleotide synthase [Altericroceibacterium spongiae]
MIEPGATIGILGGGQLGRMLSMAAAQLGYRCHIYAPESQSVAGDVSARFTSAPWHTQGALAAFARQCDVITYEFENVPVEPLAAIEADKLAPGPQALEVAQDRLAEKRFAEDVGGRPAPYAPVDTREELLAAFDRLGPGILKTRREGYDGKGQWRLAAREDAETLDMSRGGLIYEALVRFEAEFSVILVRGRDGEIRFWDSAHNEHESGILARSTLPAPDAVIRQVDEARGLAAAVAEKLGYVGVLTLEFFATGDGPVFNEMAPRVHNSGHWSIEGAVTSQFENHIRAICGLPLGDTALAGDRVEMRNLIGTDGGEAAHCLSDPQAHLHFYGKGEARSGRKMGHVTYIYREPAR